MLSAVKSCRSLEMQTARRPASRAFFRAGNNKAAKSMMIATTTNSSMRVNAPLPLADRHLAAGLLDPLDGFFMASSDWYDCFVRLTLYLRQSNPDKFKIR